MDVKVTENKNPRTGNPVTVISGIKHNPQVIEKLAKKIKSSCGAGGFVEGKSITVQGSHTKKIKTILIRDGYTIK